LGLLTGGAQDLPARQQTLRATLDWSNRLLEAGEQWLLRWLAVFAGSGEIEAVEAVCGQEAGGQRPVLDLLIGLAAHSLVRLADGQGEPRFVQLRTIREYALEQLELSGELASARQRHAQYYRALVERAAAGFRGAERSQWLERLEREHDNLREALEWFCGPGPAAGAFAIGGVLWRFWSARGYQHEGRQWLERILRLPGEVPPEARSGVLNGAGNFAFMQGDYAVARQRHTQALALRQTAGDRSGVSASLHNLGVVAMEQNDLGAAAGYFRDSLALDGKLGDEWAVANGRLLLGNVLLRQAAFDAAREELQQGLAVMRAQDDKSQVATFHLALGELALGEKNYAAAREAFRESRALFSEFGDMGAVAGIDYFIGLIELEQGNLKEAETALVESLRCHHELADKLGTAQSLEGLASLAAARSALRQAARLWGAAEALRTAIGVPLPEFQRWHSARHIALARSKLGPDAFERARDAGARLGLKEAVRQGLAPVEDEGAPTASTGRRTYPAGLTAREAEVLRCVSQGLSDAEIAEKLVISPRTVNSHLTSIYGKLGVSSRAAATRFAVDNGLA
jgi:DNA-binding CsgD family transcriptional regulator/tetratricopeptide (TPR) repeat protein